ncbi:MAG: hypothetical protein H0T76_27590 [Nannocystis sp.]|nr:hypothetical protein [Nannocystis sp.]MBA3550256.1 hypothetical protein [Nannocystis sp.]
MQTIIARFDDISRAHEAIDALLQRKYDADDISFVANDISAESVPDEARTLSSSGGAALGLLTGLGSLMIPYAGPILAAGPLALGLASTAASVAKMDEDWLNDALDEFGVPAADARAYGEAVHRGGALVIMGAREALADNITAILRSSGAVAVANYMRHADSSGA